MRRPTPLARAGVWRAHAAGLVVVAVVARGAEHAAAAAGDANHAPVRAHHARHQRALLPRPLARVGAHLVHRLRRHQQGGRLALLARHFLEERAARGDASRFALPRPLVGHHDSGCDFSFSGLKTALRQRAIELQPISETDICDLAAGFQAAIADCLTDRCRVAIKESSPSASDAGRLIVAGGVAANQFLRHALDGVAVEAGFTLTVPPPALCTDNAAMIAWAGAERLHAGSASDAGLAVPARARWPLSENAL